VKNIFKVIGIAAFAAVTVFSMTACNKVKEAKATLDALKALEEAVKPEVSDIKTGGNDSGGKAEVSSGNSGGTAENTSGKLTLTDLTSNGKLVVATGGTGFESLFCAANLTQSAITGAKVSNGSVTMKVWSVDAKGNIKNYTGSGSAAMFVLVMDKETIPISGETINDTIIKATHPEGVITVTFKNGTASMSMSDYSILKD